LVCLCTDCPFLFSSLDHDIDQDSFKEAVTFALSRAEGNPLPSRRNMKFGMATNFEPTEGRYIIERSVPNTIVNAMEARWTSSNTAEFS
jgi:hypothetical protein